jgi:hypothetical protein
MKVHEIEFVAELQKFFLLAASKTYAGGGKTEELTGLPRAKMYTFRSEEFSYYLYQDFYFSGIRLSSGMTVISYQDVPVWTMSYGGWYRECDRDVNAFLKQALLEAYAKGEFYGGRGPARYTANSEPLQDGDLLYQNFVDGLNKFTEFSGNERIIVHPAERLVHWHWYNGQLLAEVS